MSDTELTLTGKRIAFLGKLGAMTRKEACDWFKQRGAVPSERLVGDIDLVVIGAEELLDEDIDAMLSAHIRDRIHTGQATLIHEHDLWLHLGLLDDPNQRQLYTPAMVAGLAKTPVSQIRRWHRMGLLPSSKVAHRLPYFDFEQVQTARKLAGWMSQGARPSDLQKQLDRFALRVNQRNLIDLELVFDGRHILLREQGRLVESTGQMHLDFDAVDSSVSPNSDRDQASVTTLSMHRTEAVTSPELLKASDAFRTGPLTRDEMLIAAEELEDAGQIAEASEWYRVLLSQFGPNAEIVFQLAELLYRSGDITAARERYYNAIELDEDFVEARANLGCVLAELGQNELAIASFEGALARDDRYPDVHYHLARSLDETGRADQATRHWIRFLQLSPQSPWAEEALERLGKW
jgi:tetratricopeptide (TPR) repeat protein